MNTPQNLIDSFDRTRTQSIEMARKLAERLKTDAGGVVEKADATARDLLGRVDDVSRDALERARAVAEEGRKRLFSLRNSATHSAESARRETQEFADRTEAAAKRAANELRTTAEDVVKPLRDGAREAGAAAKHHVDRARVASVDLKTATKAELYELASGLEIEGRSKMTKAELVAAIKTRASN